MTRAFLLLLAAWPAQAGLFGEPAPQPDMLLWLPAERFSDWEAASRALERCGAISLTLALPPERASAARRALAPHVDAGRVELALRLPGDPILPLVVERSAGLGPGRLADRLLAETERFRVAAGTAPAGFVPGAGALSLNVLPALLPQAFRWIAAGPYARAGEARASVGRAAVVALPSASVVDEPNEPAAAESFARRLRELGAGARRCPAWRSIGSSAPAGAGDGQASEEHDGWKVARWPSWTGLSRWTEGKAASRAWTRYQFGAAALAVRLDSEPADRSALEAADRALAKAEASAFYADASPATEREHRAAVLAVFHRLKMTAPPELFIDQAADEATAEIASAPRVSRGPASLSFEAPAGSSARAPVGEPPLPDGRAASALWKIERFRVEWSEPGITLVWTLERVDPERRGLLLETYVDLDARPRAGSTQLLEPKAGGVEPGDAWEYAVSVSASGAFLLRSSALGSPVVVSRLTPVVEPGAREIRVFVPRAALRGSPDRWGWIVAAFAADPAAEGGRPPRALPGPSGGLMGLLGGLDEQRAAFATARPKLGALRADQ